MNHIICGRFSNNVDISKARYIDTKIIRVGSKKPTSIKEHELTPISTDGSSIYSYSGINNINDYFIQARIDGKTCFLVLTSKEKYLLLEQIIENSIEIYALEEEFPIFKELKFIKNIKVQFKELCNKIKKVKSLGYRTKSIANKESKKFLYKVERKIRFKNNLDHIFGLALTAPYQEVFKFVEERENREIIALDFNSMFGDCMSGNFVEPKSTYYIDGNDLDHNNIKNGLYRVIFKNPKNSFFRKKHPFTYKKNKNSYYFNLEEGQTIETLAFKNEIEHYKKYFQSYEIVEGITSRKEIKHPLYGLAKAYYKKRIQARNNGNSTIEKLYKYKIAIMHSATNLLRSKSYSYLSLSEIIELLESEYNFNLDKPLEQASALTDMRNWKYFKIRPNGELYDMRAVDLKNHENIFSLSAQVIANSRIKIIETIEKILEFKESEICYINVDSIHVSIPKVKSSLFLDHISSMISEEMGDLKIQARADYGYWFDIGRYWLVRNGRVNKFKNTSFNHQGNKFPFIEKGNRKVIYDSKDIKFYRSYIRNIYSEFTYKKILVTDTEKNIYFDRPSFNQIKDENLSEDFSTEEIFKSSQIKAIQYKNLKRKYSNL